MKKLLTFISLALCSLTAFANDYTDKLTVTVNGESMEQQATITITQQSDGKYTFSLNNFCLESVDDDGTVSRMGVGNIVLADREGTTQDGITSISYDDIITITEGDDPSIDFWMGPMIGAVPINMVARFNDTQLYCEIYIDLMSLLGQKIEVVFGTEPEPVVEEEVLTDPVITLNKDVENTIHIAVGTTSSTTHTATTYYTINGSIPSATNGTAITEDTDVTLTLTCTVKAITISTSGMQSKMVSYNFGYVAPEEVSAPTITLKEGVENVVTITVGNTNHEDEIATTYYTTDGSMPSAENGTAITIAAQRLCREERCSCYITERTVSLAMEAAAETLSCVFKNEKTVFFSDREKFIVVSTTAEKVYDDQSARIELTFSLHTCDLAL